MPKPKTKVTKRRRRQPPRASRRLNASQKAIMKTYTRVQKRGRGYTAVLVIDHQSFDLDIMQPRPRSEAQWFREQLAIALSRLISTYS